MRVKNRKHRKYFYLTMLIFLLLLTPLLIFARKNDSGRVRFLSPLIENSGPEEIKHVLGISNLTDKGDFWELVFDEAKVYLPKKNLTERLDSLQLIMSDLKKQGRKPQKIDLRYEKAVVVF